MSLSRGARKEREQAIEYAITQILGDEALEVEPDLVYALDEILASEDDMTIWHLAEATSEASNAERTVTDRRRSEDRTRSEATEAERAVSRIEIEASDALHDYVEERVEERIEDAVDWLRGDVSLSEIEVAVEEADA
jgi:hypothetical protein